jgi:uncharacterized protein YecE (DUF72 family)
MEDGVPLPEGPVVGTCGFGYQEWRGRFYPPELTAGEWLGFYARVFEAVELDGTFYRPPERSVVEFRHRSWDRPWLADLLAGVGADLALADRPGEPPWPAWQGPVRYPGACGPSRPCRASTSEG